MAEVVGRKQRANNKSSFIYFENDWFKSVIENKYDLDEYWAYVEVSSEKLAEKIRARKKVAKANEKNNTNEPLPNIFEEGKVAYMRLARLYCVAEPKTKAELCAMMIAQYIYAYGKKADELKYMKFTTLEKAFNLTEKQVGQIVTQFGGNYQLEVSKKKSLVGRPKMEYYATFDVSAFYEEFNKIDFSVLDTELDDFTIDDSFMNDTDLGADFE